ncbi:hypothetical protein GCM10007860_09120 [Chitiniphilus shinanonensis]|uniref:DUF2635 domain-containing protein n=1 Tax=Chitiniphilus shinanonensis TaxID=553088 RepID=A0ABQ6BR14_9NEIS|nr:DUF2635 domain-containing protein [Chitiniphilus shinanonensis]GLS03767.1 hypothetical protein GCM10007860_09120 [Chitiniphilus shinanonensis]
MTTRIKPRSPALLVFLPDGSGALPPDGLDVHLDTYWHRRLADGDVIAVVNKPRANAKTSPARRGA